MKAPAQSSNSKKPFFVSPATTVCVLSSIILIGLFLAIVFGSDHLSKNDEHKILAIAAQLKSEDASADEGTIFQRAKQQHLLHRHRGAQVKRRTAKERWQEQVRAHAAIEEARLIEEQGRQQQQQQHLAKPPTTSSSSSIFDADVQNNRVKQPWGRNSKSGVAQKNVVAVVQDVFVDQAVDVKISNNNNNGRGLHDHQDHHNHGGGPTAAADPHFVEKQNANEEATASTAAAAPVEPSADLMRRRISADAALSIEAMAARRAAAALSVGLPSRRPRRGYVFALDAPQQQDEVDFFHWPKSQGGTLRPPNISDPVEWHEDTAEAARSLYSMFKKFDNDEKARDTIPVFATMCVGVDCHFIASKMIPSLWVAIGHFLVVLSDSTPRFVRQFTLLAEAFPGRFTMFHRPDKLSCAESWNLVTRMAFSIRLPDMIEFLMIVNADISIKPTPESKFHMARFAEWSRSNKHTVVNRYFHFSSFSYNLKGYLELGYFDENIRPALAEDVEFHTRANSAGIPELGLYDLWHQSTNHAHRASAKERKIDERHHRGARFDYILRKWGISVPQHKDFGTPNLRPFKHPFNIPHLSHNNSWAADPEHKKCVVTGEGKRMNNSRRCYWNAEVLRKLLPENVRESYVFDKRLTTDRDSFPGPYF